MAGIQEIMAPKSGRPHAVSECCVGVDVPNELPEILKTFTKSAITTQPRDLIHWSAAYFRAMSKGQVPPVKDRLEYPVKYAPNGLSRGIIRVLHKQLGLSNRMSLNVLKPKWTDICLNAADAETLLTSNGLNPNDFSWTAFVAAAAGSIENSGISNIMETVCFVMTPEIGSTKERKEHFVPVQTWVEAYLFLGPRFNISKEDMDAVVAFMNDRAKANGGNLVGPKDFNDPNCPPLDGRRA